MTLGPDDLSRLYADHAETLFNYLGRRVGYQTAEDLVAETFRTAIESNDTFDPNVGDRRSWLFGIATNLARRHWRSEAQRLRALGRRDLHGFGVDDPLLSVADGVARRLDAVKDASLVADAVSELEPDDRELLVLSAWEQMSSREIGAILNLAPGAVRTRLHRIRNQLRTSINSTQSNGSFSKENDS